MLSLEVKFIPFTKKFSQNWGWYEDLEDAKKCTLIAEEFAIGFAEWIAENAYKDSAWRMYDTKDKEYNTKELLEIYKKEKGLC